MTLNNLGETMARLSRPLVPRNVCIVAILPFLETVVTRYLDREK